MVYNLADLQREITEGKKYEYQFFYGHKLALNGVLNNACFSQWFTSYFTFEDITFSCMEQMMMYYKALMFNDTEAAHAIMVSTEPRIMKRIGRRVKEFDPAIWADKSYNIVKNGNIAKFSSDSKLFKYLLNTDEKILVEASPRDDVWGIKLGINDLRCRNPLQWQGKNKLGFALTQARDELLGRI